MHQIHEVMKTNVEADFIWLIMGIAFEKNKQVLFFVYSYYFFFPKKYVVSYNLIFCKNSKTRDSHLMVLNLFLKLIHKLSNLNYTFVLYFYHQNITSIQILKRMLIIENSRFPTRTFELIKVKLDDFKINKKNTCCYSNST